MLRELRSQQWQRRLTPGASRWGLGLWGALARRPTLYRHASALLARLLKLASGDQGRLRHLPLAGGWTAERDMPAPQGATFQQLWQRQQKRKP
ncbi:hypothetical protein D9M70_627420 [compost metagenome]